jgi:hypothetical protein
MQVTAINPTMSQLQEMGLNPQQEPEYIGVTPDGHAKAVIDFYLREPETGATAKIRFWLENKERVSSTGKFEWIDDHATTSFANTLDEVVDWFDQDTGRKALVGEGQLLSFVSAWANVNPFPDNEGKRGTCAFEDISKLFSNDMSELKALMTGEGTADNKVKVLLNVVTSDSGRKYQDVYRYHFGREQANSTKIWEKRLNDDFTQCKGNYQNSLELQKYVDTPAAVETPQPDATPQPSEDEAPW